MERMATRGFGAKKIAAALGVPEALAAATWRRATSGDRVVRRLVCLVARVICPPSLELSCVPLVCWSTAVKRGARSCHSAHQHLDFC